MTRRSGWSVVVAALLVVASLAPQAASGAGTAAPATAAPIAVVIDTSGSMSDDDGTGRVKIDGAKLALLDFLAGIEPGTPVGLRSYPDPSGTECNAGLRRFDVAARDTDQMSAVVRTLQPDGDTPTAEAMRAAVEDLARAGGVGGTLVVVSDGLSNCDPPCDAAKEIAASGIDLETITVGFEISDEGRRELRCIADALDGSYVDAGDGEALRDTFDAIARPRLQLELATVHGQAVADGLATVEARVSNTGQMEARDVSVRIGFTRDSPGVGRPVLRLGNLAAGESPRTVRWSFRPGGHAIGRTLPFEVVGVAANARGDVRVEGTLEIVDDSAGHKAASVLKGKRSFAILGDSYSAGEGANTYFRETDTDRNSCHRSPLTYLVPDGDGRRFVPEDHVLACSGAVSAHIAGPGDHGEEPQVRKLGRLQDEPSERVDGVVLTLGGNDAGFGQLAASCITGPLSCDHRVQSVPFLRWPATDSDDFESQRLDATVIVPKLTGAYHAIHAALNGEHAVRARGVAPILVLGYPLPIPLTGGRICWPMAATLNAGEIAFVVRFATRLNGLVEGAVEQARREGVPVFYVAATEHAFLPDHTVCDGTPYARALNSFDPPLRLNQPLGVWKRSIQELVHPNADGYAAETRAIVRWSQSPEGYDAEAFLRTARPPERQTTRWSRSEVDLGQLEGRPAPTLQGGTVHPLTADGFMPGTQAAITLNSSPQLLGTPRVDAAGSISTTVAIPRGLQGGRHHIEIAGVDPSGAALVRRSAVEVEGPARPVQERALVAAAAVTGGLALAAWALLLALRRRSWAHHGEPSQAHHGEPD